MRSYNGLTPMQEAFLLELTRARGGWTAFGPEQWRTASSLHRRGMVRCYRVEGLDKPVKARLVNSKVKA